MDTYLKTVIDEGILSEPSYFDGKNRTKFLIIKLRYVLGV